MIEWKKLKVASIPSSTGKDGPKLSILFSSSKPEFWFGFHYDYELFFTLTPYESFLYSSVKLLRDSWISFVVTFILGASILFTQTWSRSLKFILCLSLSSSACSGTDIWVMYRAWGKLWGVLVFRRPIPGVDSGDISLVSLVSASPPSFFLFFSEDLFAFFCWLPQSLRGSRENKTKKKSYLLSTLIKK